MTTPFLPSRGEDQVGRLDVAVDHAPLVGVLQAQRRLVDEVAGVDHRQRAAGLHHLRQVFPVDVLHGKDDALTEPHGRVGGDDILVLQLGGRLDLTEEPVAHAGPLDQLPADDLEHFQSPHELVPGEVDHPHPAAPQLADDLVVGVVDQLGRKGVDRWGRNDVAAGRLRWTIHRMAANQRPTCPT